MSEDYEIRPADEGWFSHDTGKWIPRYMDDRDTLQTQHGQGEGQVAYLNNEPVASVTWQATPDRYILGSAYTHPDHRNQGLFTKLSEPLRNSGLPVDAYHWDNPWLKQKVRGWRQAHIANILDPIHSTLDPRVFDNPAAPDPKLKPEVQQWIPQVIFEVLERHGYDHPDQWLTLILTGSLTTYQYSDASDVDVSLFVDSKKFPDWSRAEMIGFMVSDVDDINLPGTPHPLQAYVVAPDIQPQDLYKPGLRSGYVVYGQNAGTWIVPPERDRVHDVEHEMNDAYTVGLLSADKLDLLLRYEPDKAVEYWHAMHKQRMSDQNAGKGDYATSNVVFKMLTNRGLAQQAAKLAGDSYIPG